MPLNSDSRQPDVRESAASPPPPRSLATGTVYAVLGTGCYHGCQLGVLVLLAKLTSPEIQGQYLLGIAIAMPVILLFGLELRGALVADAGNQYSFGCYRALRSAMVVPAGMVLAAVAIWQVFTEPRSAFVWISVGVFATHLAWMHAEVNWGTFQRRERLDLFAAAYALRGVALMLPYAALIGIVAWLARTGRVDETRLADAAGGAALLSAVGFLLVTWLFDRRKVIDPELWDLSRTRASVRTLALHTLPLGLVAVTINLCGSFPRWLFESGSVPDGKAQLGYFGSLAFITLAGNLIVLQAGNTAAHRLARTYQQDFGAFWRLLARLCGLALLVGAVVLVLAIFAGEWLLRTLYTPEYARFQTEFLIIVAAQLPALLTIIFGITTTQMRLFWLQVPAQLITLACTVIAALILIPGSTPVLGAALTIVVRSVAQFLLYTGCLAYGLAYRQQILRSPRRGSTAPFPGDDLEPGAQA